MSLMESWSRKRRCAKAAEEMYAVLRQGIRFEVGVAFNTESETAQAVLILRKKHPEVELVLQSNVWVLQLSRSAKVSPDGWKALEKGDYLPPSQLDPVRFLDAHAAFLNRNDTSIESAEARAFDADRTKHGIKLVDGPAAPPTPAASTPESDPK
jgi:hypothetical protein